MDLRGVLSIVVPVGLGLGGCLTDLPYHCANAEGDATCWEYGIRYCDSCRLENAGCTDKKPTIICEYPGDVEFPFAGVYWGSFAIGCEGQEPGVFVFEVTGDGEIVGRSLTGDEEMRGEVALDGVVQGDIGAESECDIGGTIDGEGDAQGLWSCPGDCEGEWSSARLW